MIIYVMMYAYVYKYMPCTFFNAFYMEIHGSINLRFLMWKYSFHQTVV